MKRFYSLVAAVMLFSALQAQEFKIRGLESIGYDLVVTYDLSDTVPNRTYTINLYSSSDNFVTPLSHVSGDIGLEVKPGSNRKITWNANKDLAPEFQGKVSLEVRGRVYIPFVRINQLAAVYKRNKTNKITWVGGRGNTVLNFELLRGDKFVTVFPNIANVGSYNFRLDNGVKPGKNYRFRITDAKNKDDIVYSPAFAVKRKVPLLVKVIPILGIAAAVSTLGGSKTDNTLPDPALHP